MTTLEAATVAIRMTFETYARAVSAGDVELWASVWDRNAIRLPPNAPALFGAPTIADHPRFARGDGRWEFAVNIEDVRAAGELAVARGGYLGSMTPPDGGKTEFLDGKFLAAFRRQHDGTWRILWECYNANTEAGIPAGF